MAVLLMLLLCGLALWVWGSGALWFQGPAHPTIRWALVCIWTAWMIGSLIAYWTSRRPAMLMAYFKLRKRNLGPILDANGWAVNTRARINIPFGTALTHMAQLPAANASENPGPCMNSILD